jgi:hypothetical protein
VASIGIAGLAVGASILAVRRSDGLPLAAALSSVAMLLLPAALWYHYLVVLLPLAIVTWPRATPRVRGVLLLAGLAVSAGVAWLPLATIGWLVMAGVIVGVLAIPVRAPLGDRPGAMPDRG